MRRFIMTPSLLGPGGGKIAKIEIPITYGTGLLFAGVVLLNISLWVILWNAPWLATTTGSQGSVIQTYFALGWLFLGFSLFLVSMGIRRIAPIAAI